MLLQNLQAEFAANLLEHTADMKQQYHTYIEHFQHLQIYQHNVQTTLVRTLENTYPLVSKLVGEDFFHIMANEYIHRYPSCSGNLYDYGEYFSDFLEEHAPVNHLTYLAEVALFEWICHSIQVAADHPSLDISALEKISPESYNHIHFILHPASYLQQFHYPILGFIDLCEGKTEENINVSAGGVHLLIFRQELDLTFVPLAVSEFTFLTAIKEGSTLAEALELALITDDSFNLDEKLPAWVQNKIIVDFYL